jgi:hypothetical protein
LSSRPVARASTDDSHAALLASFEADFGNAAPKGSTTDAVAKPEGSATGVELAAADADAADVADDDADGDAEAADAVGAAVKKAQHKSGNVQFSVVLDGSVPDDDNAAAAAAAGDDADGEKAAEEEAQPPVSFRVLLDHDPAERAAIEKELSLKDLLAGLTTESLPADAPKFLKILISQKDQHQASWSARASSSTRRSGSTSTGGAGEKVADRG